MRRRYRLKWTLNHSVCLLGAACLVIADCIKAAADVQGSQYANPSASVSTSTTGGTNINYQTNNSYNNEFGFAPGIFCRTPTFVIGAQSGFIGQQDVNDPWSVQYPENNSYAYGTNMSINASLGFVMPIGSSVIDDCKRLARQISLDRRISSELSMIRACASLQKEGIIVDPIKYPLLKLCANQSNSLQGVSSATTIPPEQMQEPSRVITPNGALKLKR